PDVLGDPVTQFEEALHLRPSEIKVAVLETQHLRDIRLVFNHERRRLRLIEDFNRVSQYLDRTRREVRILGTLRPRRHDPAHRHDVLAAKRMGILMHRRVSLRIEDDLRDPKSIPEIDKNEAAMIAPALHPSHQMDTLADLGTPKLATRMSSRRHDASLSRLAATVFTCRISASVRNRYSPGGSGPSLNGPNRIRLSLRTGCPTTSSIRLTWWVRPSEMVSSIQEFSSVFLTFLTRAGPVGPPASRTPDSNVRICTSSRTPFTFTRYVFGT